MSNIKVVVNGVEKEYPEGTTYYKISKDAKLEHELIGLKINNEVIHMENVAKDGEVLEYFDVTDLSGYILYKNALKMIFELALNRTFPGMHVYFNHSVPKGMLASISDERIMSNDDIIKIRDEMKKIVEEDHRFVRLTVKKKDAIEYYEKIKLKEKANNIRNISDYSVTLYQLDNLLNYYYSEMPYSSGVINKYDIVYLGNNMLVLLWPSKRSKGEVPEYVHYDNIIETFTKGQKWLESLKIPYIANLNKLVSSGKISNFMDSCELVYNMQIEKVARTISEKKDVKFVLIAGPSSSGKTTSCKRLANYLSAMGFEPICISTDDYFVNREDSPRDENGNYDFECLECLDRKLLTEHLEKLLKGDVITLPKFDFITGLRETSTKKISLKDNSIILIEGLHALNDEMLPGIDKELKYKVYLSPFIPLNIDRHNYISTIDLRLIRRIVRDNRSRGYGVADTMKNWESVRLGEEKNIFPFVHQADTIVNTALPYEVGVMKVYVEPLLHSVGITSEYYEEAQRLLKFFKQFFPITSEYVNNDSIIREFIGGGNNDD